MTLLPLSLASHRALMTDFFFDVFTREPWNDDWSDRSQLYAYMTDLAGNANSLCYGFFEDASATKLAALSIGSVKHWCSGTEYCIDELCVRPDLQGQGVGTAFLAALEGVLKGQGIHTIYLQTDDCVPAFAFYKKRGFVHIKETVALYKCF